MVSGRSSSTDGPFIAPGEVGPLGTEAMTNGPTTPRRRRIWTYLAIGGVVVVALLALMFVPARTDAQTLSVSPGSTATATFAFSGPTYVTMHFASRGGYGMQYWMNGPSGMMFNHSMMHRGMMGSGIEAYSDSYSFWTWGGQYRCGAGFPGVGAGSEPVWINATSALL